MNNTKPTVIIIPPKPEAAQVSKRQLRVAAYCRVSTDDQEQLTSYEAQKNYYTDKIMTNKEWTMAGIFADVYNQRLIPFDTKMAVQTIKITAFEGKNACRKPLFLFSECV